MSYTFDEDQSARTLTVTFDPPITVTNLPDRTFGTMTVRQPKMGELKRARKPDDFDTAFALLAAITGWPDKAIEELPQEVFERAFDFIQGFSKASPKAGA